LYANHGIKIADLTKNQVLMKSKATTKIVLDNRRKKNNDVYPVKLRVTFQREQKYFPTGYDMTQEEFDKVLSGNARGELKETRIRLLNLESSAEEAIQHLPVFSFQRFESTFFNQSAARDNYDIAQTYDVVIERLTAENRLNTAESYKYSKVSLCKYLPNLKLQDITPELLRDYQKTMEAKGTSRTTVGIYLRCLRAIFNESIALGHIPKEIYPFGRRQYQIPTGKNTKKALTTALVQKIAEYQPETDSEARARDIWLFSYFGNGMNIKDIVQLRYRNIDFANETITFQRAKTENSQRDQKSVKAILLPQAKQIIERLGNKPIKDSAYVFPVLHDSMSPAQQLQEKKQFLQVINKHMKRIGVKLEIDIKLTTYVARHTFATVLKRSGAPIEFISESLGHSDLKTTENYLDSFEDSTKKQWAQALVDFKD